MLIVHVYNIHMTHINVMLFVDLQLRKWRQRALTTMNVMCTLTAAKASVPARKATRRQTQASVVSCAKNNFILKSQST